MSSPGMYGISYKVLKFSPVNLKLVLLYIFNELFRTGSFPDSWLNQYVLFIKKSDGKNIRPITLSSCICKLFESLIKLRLQWWMETNDLLPSSQSRFRIGRSYMDNLGNLSLYIDQGLHRNEETIAAFLDVSGAFDNINSQVLIC